MSDINCEINPFESLECTIAFDVKDWGSDRRSAWIYGIILGWDDEECFNEFKYRFGWDDKTIEILKKLRGNYLKAKEIYEKELKGDRQNGK